MGFEGVPRAFNGGDQTVGIMALFEVARQEVDEFVPPMLSNFGVKRGAAHDGEFLRFGREENQQAVFVRGGFEAHLSELLFRGGEGIFHLATADEEDDVAGGAFLGGADCAVNAVVLQRA